MTDASSDGLPERLTRLHPKSIDLSLDRMFGVLEALGAPHLRLPPVVHVAGTNGKGSVVAYMRAALMAAGYRVHVYTSPHLVRFHERIEIGGETIAEAGLAALLDECEKANGGRPITFFEITTAAAFLAFSRAPADILLLETGLGGRLDATNVVDRPLFTVITPISLDHQRFLGDTLAEIAGEKAGVLKPGVPVAVGPQEPEACETVLARARRLGAPVALAGRDFDVARATENGFVMTDGDETLTLPRPALAGPHQPMNAAVAVAALRRLPGFALAGDDLERGLRAVRWPARLQRLEGGRLDRLAGADVDLWLDGGHNPAAGRILADMAETWRDRPLDLVVGMMNTKDPAGFVAPLAPHVRRAVAVDVPGEKNTLPAEATRAVLAAGGLDALAADGIEDALRLLAARSDGPARVLICGSLYLAGRVLAAQAE